LKVDENEREIKKKFSLNQKNRHTSEEATTKKKLKRVQRKFKGT